MTTATREILTKDQIASEQETVRHNLMRAVNRLTNNGEILAQKYMDFINGEYPDAKPYLIQAATRDLALMGGHLPEDTPGSPVRVVREEDAPKPKKPKITMKEIVNKAVGDYIRRETDDCLNLIPEFDAFLHPPYVFKSANPEERKVQKALAFKPHHTVAALRELKKHIIGGSNPYPAYPLTSSWEDRMLKSKFADMARMVHNEGVSLARLMLDIVKNDDYLNAKGEIIGIPYTQTHRFWAMRELIYHGAIIPWEHITHDAIDAYLRDLHENERQEAERRIAESKSAARAPLTPDQEASVLAMFEEMQQATDAADAKAAAKDKKKAKKAHAAKKAESDAANTGNGKNADTAVAPTDTGADIPTDRGATAVANALAHHPEVDLDTALENHHATAGVPKQNLTHDLIYDAIIAEANFQKRQQKFKNLPSYDAPDVPKADDPPNTRSP